MQNDLIAFGFNLRKALKVRGLKQIDAAEKLGISATYINQLCKGEKTPSFEMIVKISQTLKTPVCDLFREPLGRPELDRLIALASNLPDELVESLCEVAQTLGGVKAKKKAANP